MFPSFKNKNLQTQNKGKILLFIRATLQERRKRLSGQNFRTSGTNWETAGQIQTAKFITV